MQKLIGKSSYKRDTCRACGSSNLDLVFYHEATPLGEEYISEKKTQEHYPVDVFICNNCNLLQLREVVNPEILYKDYFYVTSLSLGLVKHFEDYAESLLKKIPIPENSLIVDIGSNDGVLLKAFKEKNMKILGVDPATEIARKATEQGLETIPDFFTPKLALEIKEKYGQAKIITANNVLANVDNLKEIIEAVKILMAPDGVFIVEAASSLDIIQNTIIDNIYHEHLSYFSAKSFQNFFNLYDLELIDIERTHMKGGSLRAFAQFKQGPYKKSTSVNELIVLEESMGLYDKNRILFKNFNKRVADERERLIRILSKLKSQGKTIAGFGASVGATVILYNLGIGEFIDFIFDDYKPKQFLFSPGFNIPTFPSEKIYTDKPDYIVNLAWRYAEPIIKKHQKFIENGGKFITPFSRIGE